MYVHTPLPSLMFKGFQSRVSVFLILSFCAHNVFARDCRALSKCKGVLGCGFRTEASLLRAPGDFAQGLAQELAASVQLSCLCFRNNSRPLPLVKCFPPEVFTWFLHTLLASAHPLVKIHWLCARIDCSTLFVLPSLAFHHTKESGCLRSAAKYSSLSSSPRLYHTTIFGPRCCFKNGTFGRLLPAKMDASITADQVTYMHCCINDRPRAL